jgi:hypothetical protein
MYCVSFRIHSHMRKLYAMTIRPPYVPSPYVFPGIICPLEYIRPLDDASVRGCNPVQYVPSPYVFFLESYVPWTIYSSPAWTMRPLEDATLTNVFRPQGADPPLPLRWVKACRNYLTRKIISLLPTI